MSHLRDRARTEGCLIEAVGNLLSVKGFSALGINAIAREAGVDKVLIYRYFDGLDGLLKAYSESQNFWPSIDDVLKPSLQQLEAAPAGEKAAIVLANLFDELRKRPQTIEVLRWELIENNPLTDGLASFREKWSIEVVRRFFDDDTAAEGDIIVLANLLFAGLQYLLVKAKSTRVFGGIPLRTEDGMQRLRQAIFLAFSSSSST